jgi:Big-like domain-containing protein
LNLDRVIFRGRPGVRRGLAAAACVLLPALAAPATAAAAPALTATIITWNVIGLDSNDPNAGPNQFPVGVRICNTGSSAATNVATSFSWDSANANISLVEAPGHTVGTVAAGSCRDVYYTAQITRTNAAYNTARRYHVSVSADTLATISTPTPRELFVEKLVSQNRNSFVSMSGPATVRVGDTVSYTVTTKTATNGYEQLVAATLFPPSIFDTVSTSSTYPVPAGATNDKLYADGCGWDPLPTSGTYNSCIGPAGFAGGKAGGSPIVTTYTLRVIGTGTASVGTTIYDFSGSSFHYNSDFSASVTSITALPNTPPVAVDDAASTTPGTAVAVSVLGNDSDADGDTLTVTGSTTPGHGSVTCTTSQCTYTPTAGFSGTDTFTYSIADGHGGTATATVTVTVAVALPALGVGSPLPVIVLVVALGAAAAGYRRRTIG